MADELQALLERINQEGVAKAEEERERILKEARQEADRIVQDAETKAENMVADAREESELLASKGEDSLRQAARDILLSLRQTLQDRMTSVAKACVGRELDAETLGDVVAQMVGRYMDSGGKVEQLDVLVSEDQAEEIRNYLLAHLGNDLRDNVNVTPLTGMEGGFKLNFNGEDIRYDVSDEALSEALCKFVNPRIAELVSTNLSADTSPGAGDVGGAQAAHDKDAE